MRSVPVLLALLLLFGACADKGDVAKEPKRACATPKAALVIGDVTRLIPSQQFSTGYVESLLENMIIQNSCLALQKRGRVVDVSVELAKEVREEERLLSTKVYEDFKAALTLKFKEGDSIITISTQSSFTKEGMKVASSLFTGREDGFKKALKLASKAAVQKLQDYFAPYSALFL